MLWPMTMTSDTRCSFDRATANHHTVVALLQDRRLWANSNASSSLLVECGFKTYGNALGFLTNRACLISNRYAITRVPRFIKFELPLAARSSKSMEILNSHQWWSEFSELLSRFFQNISHCEFLRTRRNSAHLCKEWLVLRKFCSICTFATIHTASEGVRPWAEVLEVESVVRSKLPR